jgi:glycosyltransferase involved in cell wall biosynthesis
MPISVIVPFYNGGAAFRACLNSFMTHAPPPAEIMVVADGDREESGQFAEGERLPVYCFPSPHHQV